MDLNSATFVLPSAASSGRDSPVAPRLCASRAARRAEFESAAGPTRLLQLAPYAGQPLATPVRLRVLEGLAWVTRDGTPDDLMLAAGTEHRFDCGRLYVSALDAPLRLAVREAPSPHSTLRQLGHAIAAGWQRWRHGLGRTQPIGGA